MNACNEHSGHETKIKRNEEDIKKLFNMIWKFVVLALVNMAILILYFIKNMVVQ